jgi:hypothetical protein
MKPSKRPAKGRSRTSRPRRGPAKKEKERPDVERPAAPLVDQPGGGPRLSAGDVDADWQRAESTGEEAVGGSVATPDQDVVDEIGRALGVEQESEAEVTTSDEILRRRDRFRWHLDRDAEARERQAEEQRDAEKEEGAG